jgi:GNAT superfamily N-acetyltransferase
MSIVVNALDEHHVAEAGRVLGEALMVEPGYAAIIPDEVKRREALVGILCDGLRHAVQGRNALGAFGVDGRILGAALWAPPRSATSTPEADQRPATDQPPYLRALTDAQLQGLMAYDEACVRHLPDEPVWYLQILGVDPAGQGSGVGSALMRASLEMVNRTGMPAYLETGTERNVRFYQRFGFAVREASLQLAPMGPTHWTMIRHLPMDGHGADPISRTGTGR